VVEVAQEPGGQRVGCSWTPGPQSWLLLTWLTRWGWGRTQARCNRASACKACPQSCSSANAFAALELMQLLASMLPAYAHMLPQTTAISSDFTSMLPVSGSSSEAGGSTTHTGARRPGTSDMPGPGVRTNRTALSSSTSTASAARPFPAPHQVQGTPGMPESLWLPKHQHLGLRHSDGDLDSSSGLGSLGLRYPGGASATGSTGSRTSEDGSQGKGLMPPSARAPGGTSTGSVGSQGSSTPKKPHQELQDTAMSPLRVGGIP
jgi:hypothetical protein